MLRCLKGKSKITKRYLLILILGAETLPNFFNCNFGQYFHVILEKTIIFF